MYIPKKSEIDKLLAYRSILDFTKMFWKYIDTCDFISGWHIEMICEHLEAVTRGELNKLVINIPPRHCKSSVVSVMWPAWSWLVEPRLQWLFASYAHSLSIRDNIKCRRVVNSPLYLELIKEYHPTFDLTRDENTKLKFTNLLGGYRLAASVGGAITGDGGDIIVCDDPNNVLESESDQIRNGTNVWFDESLRTRKNNPKKGAFVIIQQRTHETDLTGHLISKKNGGWNHLCLPSRYEMENRIKTSLGKIDPRTYEGQPLWENFYGDKELKDLEKDMGSYAIAGQLQQRPCPREGGMFRIGLIDVLPSVSDNLCTKSIRYWDKASTAGGGCYTAGVLIHMYKDGRFVVGDVVRGQWSALEREKTIKNTAVKDGINTTVWIEQEPGSSGKDSAEATIRNLAGFSIFAERPTGSKEDRAIPLSSQIEGNNVCVVKGKWNTDYLHELGMFPVGKFRDQVDASTGAFNKLFSACKRGGAWGSRYSR